LNDDAEFVAAQSRKENRRVGQFQKPCADFPEHEVAARVAIDVVDLLESVEVDQAHVKGGGLAGALLGQRG
jgi:hypothetical protein